MNRDSFRGVLGGVRRNHKCWSAAIHLVRLWTIGVMVTQRSRAGQTLRRSEQDGCSGGADGVQPRVLSARAGRGVKVEKFTMAWCCMRDNVFSTPDTERLRVPHDFCFLLTTGGGRYLRAAGGGAESRLPRSSILRRFSESARRGCESEHYGVSHVDVVS